MNYPLLRVSECRDPPTLAANPLSGPVDVVRATEELALPTSWSVLLRIGISVLATAALIWTIGPTLILGCVLLFWAVLCAVGFVLWWRKTRNVEVVAQQTDLLLAHTLLDGEGRTQSPEAY
jgi:hypothetical protein